MKKLLIALLAVAGVITGGFLYTSAPSTLNIGAELPQAPALFETSLAAPITANATEMTLVSNSIRGGGTLSGYNCFTIDEGSAQAEFVCGNASGTAVTNLVRGISPSDGISEVAALKFPHRRGASVKITDFPIIQLLRAQNNGDATFENVLRYAGDVVPSGASDLADVGYVLSVVNGGAVDFDSLVVAGRAGETVATGTLVYFARADQEWYRVDVNSTTTWQNRSLGITQGAGTNGTSIGGGGVLLMGRSTVNTGLVAGSLYFASTSGAIATTSSALTVGEADSTSVLYFDPSRYNMVGSAWNNTFTGNNVFNGTTTFNGNTVGIGTASTTFFRTVGTSTYIVSPRAKVIQVRVFGGGGGGGAGDGSAIEGAGGASGGWCELTLNPNQIGTSTQLFVGAGGAGSLSGTGGSGATSTFGIFCSAGGGSGGAGNSNAGSSGGVASTSNLFGQSFNGNPGNPGGSGFGANGASGALGGAARGTNVNGPGQNASPNSGAGGAGGSNATGGDGGSGLVIVTEYF